MADKEWEPRGIIERGEYFLAYEEGRKKAHNKFRNEKGGAKPAPPFSFLNTKL